jgi:hypothetical protein
MLDTNLFPPCFFQTSKIKRGRSWVQGSTPPLAAKAAYRGFIKYLPAYEQGQRMKSNPASGPEGTVNSEPVNAYDQT